MVETESLSYFQERSRRMLASLKLLDLMADKADSIARQWAKDVIKNPKTPYYHKMDRDKILPQAIEFYQKLSREQSQDPALLA